MRRELSLALLTGVCAATPAWLGAQQFESGPRRAALIELYTSEGCSSCPPAEQWLSSLADNPALWRRIVPVAFHVTYWDDLGWKDRWSQPAYTRREYAYAGAWNEQQVYTPCFVVNGAEWHPASEPFPAAAGPAGRLTALARDGSVAVSYQPAVQADARRLQAHAAMLGMGLQSHVLRGENKGATLAHDFIVLALLDAPLDSGSAVLRLPAIDTPGRRALAVWITPHGSLVPLQATGGWLH